MPSTAPVEFDEFAYERHAHQRPIEDRRERASSAAWAALCAARHAAEVLHAEGFTADACAVEGAVAAFDRILCELAPATDCEPF